LILSKNKIKYSINAKTIYEDRIRNSDGSEQSTNYARIERTGIVSKKYKHWVMDNNTAFGLCSSYVSQSCEKMKVNLFTKNIYSLHNK
tara:strand:- start:5078 stop:5341 length:264 start_codon:yes stop_codon:yes gene_type:complete